MRSGHFLALALPGCRVRFVAQTGDLLWWTSDGTQAMRFGSSEAAEKFRAANFDGPVRVGFTFADE